MAKSKPAPPGSMRYPEAAAYLGMHAETLRRLVIRKAVRCMRPTMARGGRGVRVLFTKTDLDAYLAKTANKAP